MTKTKNARVWTLFSSYSTDHDAMKWSVSKDSEITCEVEKPERVKVIALDDILPALQALEKISRTGSHRYGSQGYLEEDDFEGLSKYYGDTLQECWDLSREALEPFREILKGSNP